MSAPSGLFVGLATLDVVQLVGRLPAPNQKLTAQATWLVAGGPASNAAIAFAALGGRARLWTALGDGVAADAVRRDLNAAGVELIDAAPAGFELAASSVMVHADTGARAVVSGSGHRPELTALSAPELSGTDVVLLDGHLPELALAAAREAHRLGIPVVVDAGSHKPVFDQVFPLASDVICSADYRGLSPDEILSRGANLVAVSHGAAPLDWFTVADAGQVLPPSVPAVDTLGAGDVLHGAYAFALAQGLERAACLTFAVGAATERVRHRGPLRWREELRKLAR